MKTIFIVGSGLAGALAAIFFAKKNYQVHVFEKRKDLRIHFADKGRSINLALAERGLLALEKADLKQEVLKYAIPMYGRMVHPRSAKLYFLSYTAKQDKCIYSVCRQELNKTILQAADNYQNIYLHFEHTLASIDWETNTAVFNNPISEKAQPQYFDLIIGADGINSNVRKAILGNNADFASLETLPHCYKEIALPEFDQQQVKHKQNSLHIWPRSNFMLIALPNPNNIFTGTLFLPTSGENNSFESLEGNNTINDFFKKQFPDLSHLLVHINKEWQTNPMSKLSSMYCKQWTLQDKALLIGDAAHAIVPFHGQGMNAAFEDITTLDTLMQEHKEDWLTINEQYFISRKANTDAIAKMALDNYIEMRKDVIDDKFFAFKAFEWTLENLFPDYFLAQYEMVMFTHIPYLECQNRGNIQKELINKLQTMYTKAEDIDPKVAGKLIQEKLTALSSIEGFVSLAVTK